MSARSGIQWTGAGGGRGLHERGAAMSLNGVTLYLDADAVDAVRVALAAGAISQADVLRTAVGWRLGGLT